MNKQFFRIFSILFLSLFVGFSIHAEEGMFLPEQIPYDSINETHQANLTSEKIQRYMKGVMKVYMGGSYGSGSFISPKGLILTNWHVAYDCIQTLREMGSISDEDTHFAMDSYYASTTEQELHCPNYESHVTLEIRDITDELTESIPENATDVERANQTQANIAQSLETCNQERAPAICEVKHLPNVDRYVMHVQNRYRDVRLVYIPSSDMGAFGGDAFNFQYPRYSGDFAFLRAYAPENGEPSHGYNATHIPLNTSEVFLVPSLDDLQDNDFVMVLGYPGGSDRVLDGFSLQYRFEHLNPLIFNYYRILSVTADQVISELESDDSEEAQSQLEGLRSYRASVTNGMQAYQAMIEGAQARNLVESRLNLDRRLASTITADENLQTTYGDTLPTLDQFYQNHVSEVIAPQYFFLRGVRTNAIINAALQLIQLVRLSALPEDQRPPDAALNALRDQYLTSREVSNMDRKFLENYFNFLLTTPGDQYPAIHAIMENLLSSVTDGVVEPDRLGQAIVEAILNTSPLFQSEESRRNLLSKSESELVELMDSLILLGIQLTNQFATMQGYMASYEGIFPRPPNRVDYVRALQVTSLGSNLGYYDANRTLRLTYGKVSGYQWGDYRVNFATTFTDMLQSLLNGQSALSLLRPDECFFAGMCAEEFGNTQVNFAATLDVTGGNSGSAVINQEGKVVGAIFDGNWESVVNDFDYRESGPERSVSVSLDFAVKYTAWDLRRHDVGDARVVEEIRRAAGN